MFRRGGERHTEEEVEERVDSVLGEGIAWRGSITGIGGVRIDGAFEGDIRVRGLVVIGNQGRVTCSEIRAVTVIVAGAVKGNITANRVEIGSTGRVWGDVVTVSFTTQEGAFLKGRITMEEQLDLGLAGEEGPPSAEEQAAAEEPSEQL